MVNIIHIIKKFLIYKQWGVTSLFHANTFNLDTGKAWQLRRSSFKHAFTSTTLRHFDKIIFKYVSKMSSILEIEAKSENIVKVDKLFGKMTIDIICGVAFAFEINALDNSEISEEMNGSVNQMMEVSTLSNTLIFIYNKLECLGWFIAIFFNTQEILFFLQYL